LDDFGCGGGDAGPEGDGVFLKLKLTGFVGVVVTSVAVDVVERAVVDRGDKVLRSSTSSLPTDSVEVPGRCDEELEGESLTFNQKDVGSMTLEDDVGNEHQAIPIEVVAFP